MVAAAEPQPDASEEDVDDEEGGVASRIGVRSGCRVSRPSRPGSRASRGSPITRPPVRAADRGEQGGAVAAGRSGAQLGREGQRHAAAGVGGRGLAGRSVASNSRAPVSTSGWKLAS